MCPTNPRSSDHAAPHRLLRPEEIALVEHLAADAAAAWNFERALVEDMEDGGMGSIRFLGKDGHGHRFGKVYSECEYRDVDGVTVLITLVVDRQGYPFELDFWKVDFLSLKRFPTKDQVRKLKLGEST